MVELDRKDLARLLRYSSYSIQTEESFFDEPCVTAVALSSPRLFAEALKGLPEQDHKRIREAIAHDAHLSSHTWELEFHPSDAKEADGDRLLPEVVIHRNELVKVATGALRIEDVNDYYRARHRRISAGLKALGLEHRNPHPDLWDFYQKWRADLPTWASRRQYVATLYDDLIASLCQTTPAVVPRKPTGWERVDRALARAQGGITTAQNEEDFQALGLMCREILISAGQAVFDPARHSTPDGVAPSSTDAARMIEAFIVADLSGGTNEAVRKHVRASLALAVELQHRRTATFQLAALCLEATASVVNILAILSGRRAPALPSSGL